MPHGMNSVKIVKTYPLGAIASTILDETIEGSVFGKTSSGTFIKTLSDRILFITHLPFPGPLTINLKEDNPYLLDRINNGMKVIFSPQKIFIPEIELEILASKDAVHHSPLPSTPIRNKEERHKAIRFIASQMNLRLEEYNNLQYSSLLEIINYEYNNAKLSKNFEFNHISQIVRDIKTSRFEEAIEGINEFLGGGQGLTPSGDDIVIGITLSINRWKDVLIPNIDLESFNQQVIGASYDRTTTLSANLIECAAQGEADERLINTVDFLISELPYKKNIVENLLHWGDSSGIFVFWGMAITIMNTNT